jgi:hypothetical protein
MSPQKRGIPIGSVVVAPLSFFQPNLSITRAQLIFQKGSRAFAAGLVPAWNPRAAAMLLRCPAYLAGGPRS